MPDTILAFDFGTRRIGVATGQQVTRSASPLAVVSNGEQGPDFGHIARLIEEWRPGRLVVGLPRHADGSLSEIGSAAQRFIEALKGFGLPVDSVDERDSSVEAERLLKEARARGSRGRIRKHAVDSAAAVMIAERWLAGQ